MLRKFKINNKLITLDTPPYIIAEVGHNHQGSIDLCKKIFLEAKKCGASAVKLQKRNNKKIFSTKLYNQIYNSNNSFGRTYGAHREKLEFNLKEYNILKEYCKKIKIDFFATAFDLDSLNFLRKVGCHAIKIASGDCCNIELIEAAAKTKLPLIISTGGATLEDVKLVYKTVSRYHKNFVLLQCTSGYPPQFENLNIKVIETYQKLFKDILIGYSGHENGVSIPVACFALGARVIEKHFTVDRTLKGTDQALSLSPSGLRKLTRDLYRASLSLGDGIKKTYDVENLPLSKMTKIFLAKKKLRKNHKLKKNDLILKIDGSLNGFKQNQISMIIGKKLNKNLKKDEVIIKKYLKN
jgi:sialic acid synthase